ncbi:MAG: 7-cyano-7-deazaguanine synthase QueC [Woeseiaceae bacterium]|nr:7-cyano-7-deazaguanine synthase QueC [Woeseiaceae bacterium]
MVNNTDRALVVLSGGQDSTTCLYWALRRFGEGNVATVSFDYGQRHRVELQCAARIALNASVSNACLPIDTFAALGGDALTDTDIVVDNAVSASRELPNTFVPGRNLVFLTFAAAFAYRHGIDHLVTGVAQTDYSGYPDCREETLESLQQTLRLGMESNVTLHAPLMYLSKKETVELAQQLGCLAAMADTHTCYNGERPPCGSCPACALRAKGFAEAGVADPLLPVP